MPLQNLEHAKMAMKWLYFACGMAKWGKWADSASPVYIAYSVVEPGTMDLAYQVAFTGYALLHIIVTIAAIFNKRRK